MCGAGEDRTIEDHDENHAGGDVGDHGQVAIQPPLDLRVLLRPIPTAAVGLTAVRHSVGQTLSSAGTRGLRSLLSINQRDGFDCPSCAWADPEDRRSFAEFCENGAKALADAASTKIVDAAFFARHSVAELSAQSDQWLNAQGRLVAPMVLLPGATHYTPLSWNSAFSFIARELNAGQSADEAVFYTSGKASNEAAFLYQLFARMYGTNNLPDCSNMCHESSGAAIRASLGVGKATVTLHDLEHAECILVIGQNPGTNHPRMLTSLQAARRNGATIIAVNPLHEVGLRRFKNPQEVGGIIGSGTEISDHFLQVRINGDAALFKGILKSLFACEAGAPGTVFDAAFIREHTSGFDEFAAGIATAEWPEIESQSGIGRARIEEIAGIIARSKSVVACWAMGLTQHKNSVAVIRELINILLVGGHIGRPDSGVFPVRGHSNVQGDRTMGVWGKMDDAFLDRLGAEFAFTPPREHGYDVVDAIRAMLAKRVRLFMSLGGNFLSASPDTEQVARGLRNVNLTVCISTKLNRGHLVTGRSALLLPCLTRLERDMQATGQQFLTVENTVSVVSRSKGQQAPAGPHLRSEPAIVAGIAQATLGRRYPLDWEGLVADYDRIRDRISRVVAGFTDFNARVSSNELFYAPVPAKERIFNTPSGKAEFCVNVVPSFKLAPDQYVLMTIRTHDQFNTVIYGADDRYRGVIGGRRVILMNAEDAAAAALVQGDRVDITSHFAGQRRQVTQFSVVPFDIPRRCTAAYYPEANPLVPLDSTADISNTPTSKFVIVTLERSAGSRVAAESAG